MSAALHLSGAALICNLQGTTACGLTMYSSYPIVLLVKCHFCLEQVTIYRKSESAALELCEALCYV